MSGALGISGPLGGVNFRRSSSVHKIYMILGVCHTGGRMLVTGRVRVLKEYVKVGVVR